MSVFSKELPYHGFVEKRLQTFPASALQDILQRMVDMNRDRYGLLLLFISPNDIPEQPSFIAKPRACDCIYSSGGQ
jgi:hypothetical protein